MTAEHRPQVVVVRHGQTLWSREGRHTGRTDVALDAEGEEQARRLSATLGRHHFDRVLTSPLRRAADTCRLAGMGSDAQSCDDLMEWDYGAYEGRTTPEIRAERPGWWLWRDGVPGGETLAELGARADRVVAAIRQAGGEVAVFAHGHLLRVLAARWAGLPPAAGAALALTPGRVGRLGWEHEAGVVAQWSSPVLDGP